ncbi:uncharacterized protein METZ01_LOCUS487616, partial [marine metagenome]
PIFGLYCSWQCFNSSFVWTAHVLLQIGQSRLIGIAFCTASV